MPDWQPNWNNVRWDPGAAEAACAALHRMADMLDRTAGEQQRAVAGAQAGRREPSADRLDEELEHAFSSANSLAKDCREAANYIAQLSQRAHDEQRDREVERACWNWEKTAEDRRQNR